MYEMNIFYAWHKNVTFYCYIGETGKFSEKAHMDFRVFNDLGT